MGADSPDVGGRPAVEHAAMAQRDDVPRIVIAGGGVAGLETCLALRAFIPEDDLRIDLLSRDRRFEYRPLTVLEPFGGAPAWKMERLPVRARSIHLRSSRSLRRSGAVLPEPMGSRLKR